MSVNNRHRGSIRSSVALLASGRHLFAAGARRDNGLSRGEHREREEGGRREVVHRMGENAEDFGCSYLQERHELSNVAAALGAAV